MKSKLSHQSKWKKSVFQVYKDASLNLDWTPKLYNYCKKIGIDFFTSPYSIDLVDHVDKFVPAYKIGSGDITWLEIIKHISKKKKPVILASGASNMQDVVRAIKTIKKYNSNICIMQCNTNYTASEENFNYINLNVLKSYRKKFKNIILGLSDHTLGHSTVLGAISLGAKIIEKHFTLSNNDQGPDHKFSMTLNAWINSQLKNKGLSVSQAKKNAGKYKSISAAKKAGSLYYTNKDGKVMIAAYAEDLKMPMKKPDSVKKIEKNELDTAIVQRRSLHFLKDYKINEKIRLNDFIALRPCPRESVEPYEINKIKDKRLKKNKHKGDVLLWKDLK